MSASKFDIEKALHEEHKAISAGKLKEDNPLDLSADFNILCEACRRGDLRVCQEQIQKGVNINARDRFDYTPLILASLCGHYEVAQLLLESGALCERDTFQGERCLYNALNDRIRNLLLQYDYSKSTDPLQPWAAHITSLLTLDAPQTSDITLTSATSDPFHLHKFVLAARSPYFAKKLETDPAIKTWKLSNNVPGQSFDVAVRYLYMGEVSADLGEGEEEQAILTGISKVSKHLEIEKLFENILEGGNRQLARQRRTEEVDRGSNQFAGWFKSSIIQNAIRVPTAKADDIRWDRDNAIFADVLLRADDEPQEKDEATSSPRDQRSVPSTHLSPNGIPIGPSHRSRSPSRTRPSSQSTLFPAHRSMLIRADFFNVMFTSPFKEAQETPHLQIVSLPLTPPVLAIVLEFLYTESCTIPLPFAIDVLFAADLLFIEKLKVKAATIISTLGTGGHSIVESENSRGDTQAEDVIDIFEVVRAGWDTRVQRLEEFGARYIAYRLERYIDEEEFAELVKESAARVKERQETDTVELVDDIRYYLSERFRLRFEDLGLEEESEDLATLLPGAKDQDENSLANGVADMALEPAVVNLEANFVVRTLDGEIAGDEFEQDAMNYQILLGKIDTLLDKLSLDA